jgi:hypothetical protein
MTDKNPLKGMIYAHFGSYQHLARHLNLSTSTVADWVRSCPRNILKYMPEITTETSITADELLDAVIEQDNKLQ